MIKNENREREMGICMNELYNGMITPRPSRWVSVCVCMRGFGILVLSLSLSLRNRQDNPFASLTVT